MFNKPDHLVLSRTSPFESELCKTSPGYRELVSHFKDSFADYLQARWNTEEPFCPVMLITFIISLYIAVENDFREAFYLYFQNKTVPSITVLVLENLQAGIQSKDVIIEGVDLNREHAVTHTGGCLGETLFDSQLFGRPKGRDIILSWFAKLNRYNQGDKYFASTVLTKQSLNTLETTGSPLLMLSTKFSESYFREFSDPYSYLRTEPSTTTC